MDVEPYNLTCPAEFTEAVEAAADCARKGKDGDSEAALTKVFNCQGGKPEQLEGMLAAFRDYCKLEPNLDRPEQFRREYRNLVRSGLALKANKPPSRSARNKKLQAIKKIKSPQRKQDAIARLDEHTWYCITSLMEDLGWDVDRACEWLLADTGGERMKAHRTHLELWLAQEYLKAGGEITIYLDGDFAKLLQRFRKDCGIPGTADTKRLGKLRDEALEFLAEVDRSIASSWTLDDSFNAAVVIPNYPLQSCPVTYADGELPLPYLPTHVYHSPMTFAVAYSVCLDGLHS